jgi:Bacterial Ig-like domain
METGEALELDAVLAFRSLAFVAAVAIAGCVLAPFAAAQPVRAATAIKVALIVGPTGSGTAQNRSKADAIATQVAALGATVTKAYSPNATYAKVRAAVAGANIIVYMGHGNGFPNPHLSKLYADRDDGWGLNTTTTNGDSDSWSAGTMVYCGEKALEGLLTSSDGAAQRQYCAGAIAPAPGFVMVYLGACYTAGNNEDGMPAAANSDAKLHLAYYSRPILTALHGSGYFAGGASNVVADLIQHPDESYGDIWADNLPSGATGTYDLPHALVAGAHEWLTSQSGAPYWYWAFAGDPSSTFNGGTATVSAPPTGTADFSQPTVKSKSPGFHATGVLRSTKIRVTFSEPVKGASTHVTLWHGTTKLTIASFTWDATTNTITLTPSSKLAASTTYSVKVDQYVKDLAGNPFVATSWWFQTGAS